MDLFSNPYRESGSLFCPWHHRLYDTMFGTGYPWRGCMNECHEFNAAQASQYTLPEVIIDHAFFPATPNTEFLALPVCEVYLNGPFSRNR